MIPCTWGLSPTCHVGRLGCADDLTVGIFFFWQNILLKCLISIVWNNNNICPHGSIFFNLLYDCFPHMKSSSVLSPLETQIPEIMFGYWESKTELLEFYQYSISLVCRGQRFLIWLMYVWNFLFHSFMYLVLSSLQYILYVWILYTLVNGLRMESIHVLL